VDEEQLVCLAVAVERVGRHRLRRAGDAHRHVTVEEERHASRDRVALRLQALGVDQPVAVRVVVGLVERDPANRLHLVRPGGWHEVVEQRAATGEALHPEQLLRVERAVRSPVLGVALVGDVAERQVEQATGLLASWQV
jgi:hypothetical protein